MTQHKEVIQAIRLKRTLQQAQALVDQGEQLEQTLMKVSGLQERGIDPHAIEASPEELARLLALAEKIESEHLLLEPQPGQPRGRQSV